MRVLERARMRMPSLALVWAEVWADGADSRRCSEFAARALRMLVHVVAKPAGQRGFTALPRRWVVERTLAWLVQCRRLDSDDERLSAHAEAMVNWAMIGLMVRRLAPGSGRRPWQHAPTR